MPSKSIENSNPLRQLYVYLTDNCNLSCRHCWISPQRADVGDRQKSLRVEFFKSAIEQAIPLGLTTVKLTGGEPLIHPDIREIVAYLNTRDMGNVIETNGVNCSAELSQLIAAGSNAMVSVSLDGAEAETHEWLRGTPGCFDQSVAGIRNLVEAGVNVQIIMTLFRRNKEEIPRMIEFAETRGVGSVKFNIVQPILRGEKLKENDETLSIKELISIGDWVENERASESGLKVIFSHPMAFRPLGKMFGETGDGCQQCGITEILGILPDGSMALCGIGKTISKLVFGHLERDQLSHVWNQNPMLREIRQARGDRFSGICGRCLMKHICMGCCMAQNYYQNKRLWGPNWYCEEAFRLGLFPGTRLSG